MVLHQAAGFDAARLVVVAFGRRSSAMTEQAGSDADMCRILDRNASGGAITKQVRVDRLSQSFTRTRDNADVDRVVGHWQAVHRQPQLVAGRTRAEAAQRHDTRAMVREISLDVSISGQGI